MKLRRGDTDFARVPPIYTGAGAPTSSTLRKRGYRVGDLYWDTSNAVSYICSVAGTSTTAVWNKVGAVTSVSTTDHALTLTPTTGDVVGSLTKTSDISGQKLPALYSGAGAPAAGTLSAGTYGVGDLYWDTTNNNFYICKTSGSNSTSVWAQINGSSGVAALVGARVLLSANRAGNASFTAIDWGNNTHTVAFDTNSFFSGGSSTILTVPTGKSGYYRIYGHLIVQNGGTAGHLKGRINKNSDALEWFFGESPIDTVTGYNTLVFGITIPLVATDVIEIDMACSSGADCTLSGANFVDGTAGLNPGICTFGMELVGT